MLNTSGVLPRPMIYSCISLLGSMCEGESTQAAATQGDMAYKIAWVSPSGFKCLVYNMNPLLGQGRVRVAECFSGGVACG